MVEGSGAPNNLLARASVGTAQTHKGQQEVEGPQHGGSDPLAHARSQGPAPYLAGTGEAQEEPPGWDPQGAQGSMCQTAPG